MKQVLIILSFFISATSFAQVKDTIQKDTITILTYADMQQIVYYIQLQASNNVNVKPEIWNEIIALLYKRTQVIPRQQPKK